MIRGKLSQTNASSLLNASHGCLLTALLVLQNTHVDAQGSRSGWCMASHETLQRVTELESSYNGSTPPPICSR